MFEVKIDDLKPGVFYLARDRNHDTFHFQGIFEGIYLPGPYKFAQFGEARNNSCKVLPFLRLCELHFVFYEKSAEIMAYTNAVLRKITGDPDIFYWNFSKNFNQIKNRK